MTAEEILDILEKQVAPVKLSDDFCASYKMYDNSGIIINCGKKISGALFSLDLSEAAVNRAEELGYNIIVTHHPAIYGGISRFDLTSSPQARALAKCLKNGISVISMHLNFDAAPQGIDYYLMCGLGGKNAKISAAVEGGGYGRLFEVCPVSMPQIIENIKNNFSTERIVVYGDASGEITKVASFCGAGCDDSNIAFARQNGAQVFVSSDLKHHQIAELVESGIAVIQLTHYCAENYGFSKIYDKVKTNLQIGSSFFFDGRFA